MTDVSPLLGSHRAVFPVPVLKSVAPLAIRLAGMPRWHGKYFEADIEGVLAGHNWLRAKDGSGLVATNPMTASVQPSWLDGRPVLAVGYGASAPRPWRWVRDEFRPLNEGALVGLTFAGNARFSGLSTLSPFVLLNEDCAGLSGSS